MPGTATVTEFVDADMWRENIQGVRNGEFFSNPDLNLAISGGHVREIQVIELC